MSLVIHKFFTNHDTTANKKKAYDWASANAVDYFEALDKLGLSGEVIGLDNMNDYYSPGLKEDRINQLKNYDKFSFVEGWAGWAKTKLKYPCRILVIQMIL